MTAPPMSDGDQALLDARLRAIQSLKGWGATSVRIGDIAVTFGALALLPEMPDAKPLTPEEQEAADERMVTWSSR